MAISQKSGSLLPLLLVLLLSGSNWPLGFAQHPDADTFLLHALSWMTLRENGVLLTENQLGTILFGHIKDIYSKVPFYGTFVAAFEFGVHKKMTLNENDDCDPTYSSRYKYWFNDSTTEYQLIYFVMADYYHQYDPSVDPSLPSAYCDYRQGLVCSKAGKCECPSGAKMSTLPNVPFPPNQRCLIEENEVCALIDAADNMGNKNVQLEDRLPYLIFDPEKPLGCEEGTQCRFKAANLVTPLCYSSANPAWVDGPTGIPFGEECTLSLYGSHGMCSEERTCYNYGIPSTLSNAGTVPLNKTGICSDIKGPFGGPKKYLGKTSSSSGDNEPSTHDYKAFIMEFLTPRFVPLRGAKLEKYQDEAFEFETKYLNEFAKHNGVWGNDVTVCSINLTTRMIGIYRFYLSLLGSTAPGIYVADEAALNSTLAEAFDIVKFNKTEPWDHPHLKICDLRRQTCGVRGWNPFNDENDGECSNAAALTEKEPFFENYRNPYFALYNKVERLWYDIANVNAIYVQIVIRHRGSSSYTCKPVDWGCSGDQEGKGTCEEDVSDFDVQGNAVFQDYSCDFVPSHVLKGDCKSHTIAGTWEHGACESVLLEEKVEEILEAIFASGSYTKLGLGERCNFETETLIKEALADVGAINAYKFLNFVTKTSGDNGLCDSGKLLECKSDKTCGCIKGSERRKSADGKYTSDYCYLNSGSCLTNVTMLVPLLDEEKVEVMLHYGIPKAEEPSGGNEVDEEDEDEIYEYIDRSAGGRQWNQNNNPSCLNRNVCLFLDKKNMMCTTANTGITGLDPEPVVEPEPPTPPEPQRPSGALAPPKPYYKGTSTRIIMEFDIMRLLLGQFIISIVTYYNVL